MVCKEDVVTWFKGLKSYQRADVMCTLLNMCLPFELRFLGTCLENLGKRDFHDLRKTEAEANNLADKGGEDQCISDKRVRTSSALYISLLHSCNYRCSNSLFKILSDWDGINALLNSSTLLSPDDTTLEELLLLYTLALNHPAFTVEQKLFLGEVMSKLQEEDSKRNLSFPTISQNSTGFSSMNEKIVPTQMNTTSPDKQLTVSNTSHISPINPPTSLVPGEPVLNLHDQLNSSGYQMRLTGYQPNVLPCWPGMMVPPEPTSSPSPLVSRTSSPCQSNSPSRAGSPGKPKNVIINTYNRPPPDLRDNIAKDLPNYLSSLGSCTVEQVEKMTDEELRELKLPNGALSQLRSIVNKVHNTNGLASNSEATVKKKRETNEPEVPVMRRMGSMVEPVVPTSVMFTMSQQQQQQQPPIAAAPPPPPATCIGPMPCMCPPRAGGATNQPPPPLHMQPHLYCLEQMRALRLDAGDASCSGGSGSLHCSNSSASDSASASDHSPPDTPNFAPPPPPPPNHDRNATLKEGETWCGPDERDQRVGPGLNTENDDRRQTNNIHSSHGRSRNIGRSRHNPPGIQTLPRGRGLNPNHRRREMGQNVVMNGGTGAADERKVYCGNEVQTFAYSPSPAGPGPGPGPSPYMPQTHFLRAAYHPAFPPGNFVRPSFPFHPNSEMVFQYAPPNQFLHPGPAPAPSPAPISFAMAPPKISCYNCGSQSHLPNECQDPTIEEMSKQGQYRIDYTPYQKSGECSSSSSDK